MNNKLLNEYPLIILPTLATSLGLNNSIVLQQVWYWQNMKKMGQEVDGRKWIRNSINEWQEDNFPFWSVSTIKRILTTLESSGHLKSRSDLNQNPSDRTKWYSVDYDNLLSTQCVNMTSPNVSIWPIDQCVNMTPSIITENTKTETTTETTEDVVVVEEKFSQIVRVYENEIGLLTATISDELQHMMDEYPHIYIEDAIKIAAQSNKRSLRYVKGILNNWRTNGKQDTKKETQSSSLTPQQLMERQQQKAPAYLTGASE